ncbi:solute carrier organic anion transporter family member 4A1-like [Pecten maximus]|uniref:solute carrier organic anion transporter family member 4A1-like n=1 Tax=Pecten maximus TaxID=6579 RepID=UPI0014582730|nr:solute carrier organic anion transporter family member 4A1-like [Pecten maximus]
MTVSRSQEYVSILHNSNGNSAPPTPDTPTSYNPMPSLDKCDLYSVPLSPGGSGDDKENEEETEPCGWGPFTPAMCQRFRTPHWMLFWLCWAGGIQGMVVNGFVNVVISSVERRYDLSSTESGAIASCYDIASVLCLIPVSYFGGLGCKPRYLGIGVFVMGLGSLMFSLPQFTSGPYEVGRPDGPTLCGERSNTSLEDCMSQTGPRGLSYYKYVFYLGQLMHGAGAAPLYTLGTTYLDDNLPVTSSSMYQGLFYGCAILGPAVGYLAGGAFLDLHVDIDKGSSLSLSPSGPRYVGAWWVGFLFSAALAFIVAIPLCGFPSNLPGSWRFRAEQGMEVYQTKQAPSEPEYEPEKKKLKVTRIFTSLRVLLLNPTFMFLNLAAACEGNVLAGFATFTPKFIQEQFSIPSSTAAMFVGFAAIPAGGGGTFLGGYLVKRYKLRMKGIIRLCLGLTLPSLILALCFIIHCPNQAFTGVNVPYREMQNRTSSIGAVEACHQSCDCSHDEKYHPVCGSDGSMYFSPCHAGCTTVTGDMNSRVYHNCSCINPTSQDSQQAGDGKCETACWLLPVFMPIFGLLMLLTFTSSMPALAATLRCVPPDERSFALGIQWIIARCLGSIPGPILFGKLIDMSCVLWQRDCGQDGSCFFYDNKNMSNNLLSVGLVGKFFSTLFFLLALVLYRGSPLEGSADSEDKESGDTFSIIQRFTKRDYSTWAPSKGDNPKYRYNDIISTG